MPRQQSVAAACLPYAAVLVLCVAMMATFRHQATRTFQSKRDDLFQRPARAPAEFVKSEPLLTEVPPLALERLEGFVDHATDFTPEPFFYLVSLATRLDPKALEPLAREGVTLLQLYEQANEFRGQALEFSGRVRRIRAVDAPPNTYGVARYYEAWVFTSEGRNIPYCVLSCQPPEGLPVAEQINEYVEVVGFFLGWWKHETQDRRLLSSPIVVAPRIRKTTIATAPDSGAWLLGLVLTLLLVVALGTGYLLSQRHGRPALTQSPESELVDWSSPPSVTPADRS